jgi:hypothetical protein
MLDLDRLLPSVLLLLGFGFLLANLRLAVQLVQALRLRSQALLTWRGPKPPFYRLILVIAITLGLVLVTEIILRFWLGAARPEAVFGEMMMFVYYACLLPLTHLRIGRGFYEDGVWMESGFMPYAMVGGLSWREEPELTLLLIPRMQQRLARRLVVPAQYYAEARRLLRDKIAGHELHFTGKPLDLGAHDERDDV